MYRLLALDVDGTLVNSRDEVSPATADALRRASAAGLRIVLATGRRYSRTLPLVATLGLDAPLVTASGALVKRPSDHFTLYQAELSRPLLCGVLAILGESGYEPLLYADTYHHGFDFFCVRTDVEQPELAEYLAKNAGCHRLCPKLMTDPPPGVFAGFTMGTRAQMLELANLLQRRLPDQLDTHVLRSPFYHGYMCEIAPRGATKWSAVRRLAESWQISPEEICAAGDDVNDLAMVREAGLGVAMGNAVDELKAAADRIAPTHDEDGIVQVVEWAMGK